MPVADLPPVIAMFVDAVNNDDMTALKSSIFAQDLVVYGDYLANKQLLGADAVIGYLKNCRAELPDMKVREEF